MVAIVPKNIIEEVRSRSDVVDVIGRYCRLQKAGANFKALCPFHREKTPSFHISPARQGFHCFGCGKGGDVFRFLMEYENIEFPAALRMLAEWAGVSLPTVESSAPGQSGPGKDVLFRLHDELARWYHEMLLKNPAAQTARDYLAGRDIHSDAAAEFMLGYADNSWNALLQWAGRRRFSEDDLIAGGLVVRRENAKGCYDRFRGRLMFPIRDEQSRVIAFSGRALEDGATAKYLNSPETPLFKKKRVLFGLDRARRPIVESREALICEGQIDVIRCHLNDFPTAVASQGTAFSEEHGLKLARIADGVILVFDADDAGREACVKTAIICLQCGLSVRAAVLPQGEDPDSMIRNRGAECFKKTMAAACDILDFRLDDLMQRENPGTPIGMRAITRGISGLIDAARDPLQRDRMLHHASQRLVVDPAVLRSVFRSAPVRAETRTAQPEASPSHGRAAERPAEEWALVEHLAAAPELTALARDYLPSHVMRDPGCRAVLDILSEAWENGMQDILGYCGGHASNTTDLQELLAAALIAPSKLLGDEYNTEDAVKDCILKIWRNHLNRKLQESLRGCNHDTDGTIRMECAQLRTDIKRLARWESGAAIIEMLV